MKEQHTNLSKEDYTAFIGKHAATYLSKFEKFHVKESDRFKLTWHWPVFFAPFLWMLYRKLYLWALMAFLLNVMLLQPFIPLVIFRSFFPERHVFLFAFLFSRGPFLLSRLLLGITGYYLYYKHTKKKIFQIRQEYPFAERQRVMTRLTRAGGVNDIAPVIAALALPVIFVFCLVLPILISVGHTRKIEAEMKKPEVYKAVAHTLALYCQSDPKFFSTGIGYAWFPEELRRIKHGGWGGVSPHRASIEMGGGFHHYGYRLVLDQQMSTAKTNVWDLYLYSEDSKDKHLYTLPLSASDKMSASSLLQQVLSGYDQRIADKPFDLRAHQGKIQLLLRFDQIVEARQASKELLNKMPDNWWANLVNALIMAEEQSPQEAERFFVEWVERQPDFFKYLDLAYYYQLQNQPQKAAAAMIRATDYDVDTSLGHGGNSKFRGYTAAMYAFESGEYETTIQLCDKLLALTNNVNYAKQELGALRDVAMRKIQGKNAEVLWSGGIAPFDAFKGIDIEKILQRKVERPTEAKYYKTRRNKHTPTPTATSTARHHQKTKAMAETQVITVSDANFTQIVLHSELPVMVDFWAPWCGPCRKAAPAVGEAARKFSGKLRIAKLNIDDNKKTASKYGVRAIPTFIFFHHGKEIGRTSGFGNEQRFFNNIRQLLTQKTSSFNQIREASPTTNIS